MIPMTAAAIALPSERKRALRPSLTLSRAWPTIPRLIAAIVGPIRQLATACSSLAATTGLKLGHTASRRALALPKILLALSAGLTQEQAAKAVGINRTTLHRWREAMPEF